MKKLLESLKTASSFAGGFIVGYGMTELLKSLLFGKKK